MEKLCRLFGKGRQAWYQATLAKESTEMQELMILEEVKVYRAKLSRGGSVKIHKWLREFFEAHGIKMGRDKFHKLLKKYGMLVPKYKRGTRTTNSNHWFRRYKNLIEDLTVLP